MKCHQYRIGKTEELNKERRTLRTSPLRAFHCGASVNSVNLSAKLGAVRERVCVLGGTEADCTRSLRSRAAELQSTRESSPWRI